MITNNNNRNNSEHGHGHGHGKQNGVKNRDINHKISTNRSDVMGSINVLNSESKKMRVQNISK